MFMKVLVVEDEKKVASFIKKGLASEGYSADLATDGEEGFFLANENDYDLIIMDIMLPKMDGITLCRKLRAKKRSTPIIMLSAKDTVEDRVAGLEAGADDYLTKPFSFSELLARLRAVERRSAGSSFGELKVGDLRMNIDAHTLSRGTKDIKLSSTEFRLLKFMMENAGKALSKTIILEKVWGYDFSPESNIVDVYIKYLRDKVDKNFKKPLIHTVHGVGYKLCE